MCVCTSVCACERSCVCVLLMVVCWLCVSCVRVCMCEHSRVFIAYGVVICCVVHVCTLACRQSEFMIVWHAET